MAQKFKTADIVRLKSGGPEMTVKGYSNDPFRDEEEVICVWFKNDTPQQKNFSEDLLETVDKSPLKITMK